MWDRPDELIGRVDVDKYIQEPPHKKTLDDSRKTGKRSRNLNKIITTKGEIRAKWSSATVFVLATSIAKEDPEASTEETQDEPSKAKKRK